MRHSKQSITERTVIEAIIRDSRVMRLAMSRDNHPYLLPLCFGYDGSNLFFHTGQSGLKIDILSANPRVCFEFERAVRALSHPDLPCKWSMVYESVVGSGSVVELSDPAAREHGLQTVMRQYSNRDGWAFDPKAMDVTRVWRIDIASLTGRRSKQGWEQA